jgi:membrane protease YdiL (CAAX protease family)
VSEVLRIVLWPFWNVGQRRVRALWRLLLFLVPLGAAQFGLQRFFRRGLDGFMLWEIVVCALTVVLAVGCTFLLDRRGLASLGWTASSRAWADLAFGAFLGAALISGVVAIEWAAGWLVPLPGSAESLGAFLLKALVLFMAAGAAEEFAFRSYLLRNLADGLNHRRWGPKWALLAGTVLSSALFGMGHADNPNATVLSSVNIAVAGIFLATGYVMTGRLALPVGLHVAWNYFQGPVFGVPVSGIDLGHSLVPLKQGGPALWTGGPFGIEGGLLGLLAMLVGVAATAAWVKWREGSLTLATSLLYDEPPQAIAPPTLPEPPAGEAAVLA